MDYRSNNLWLLLPPGSVPDCFEVGFSLGVTHCFLVSILFLESVMDHDDDDNGKDEANDEVHGNSWGW